MIVYCGWVLSRKEIGRERVNRGMTLLRGCKGYDDFTLRSATRRVMPPPLLWLR